MPSNKVRLRIRLRVDPAPKSAPVMTPTATGIAQGTPLLVLFGIIGLVVLGLVWVVDIVNGGDDPPVDDEPTQVVVTVPEDTPSKDTPEPEPPRTPETTPIPVNQIGYNQEVTGTISSRGDSQSWVFRAEAGDKVAISTFQVDGAAFQPAFGLYDPSGERVTYQNDCNGGNYFNDLTNFELKFSGVYTIKVEEDCGSDTGRYRLSLSLEPPAAGLSRGQAVTGSLAIADDYVDYVISLSAGETVTIAVARVSGEKFVPAFDLLDPSGEKEAMGWGCPQGRTGNSIQRTIKFTGVYTIRVYGACLYDIGEFSLSVN